MFEFTRSYGGACVWQVLVAALFVGHSGRQDTPSLVTAPPCLSPGSRTAWLLGDKQRAAVPSAACTAIHQQAMRIDQPVTWCRS
jgi:hypothetical protein